MAIFLPEANWINVTGQLTDNTWSTVTVSPPASVVGALVVFVKPDGLASLQAGGTRGVGWTETGNRYSRFRSTQRALQSQYAPLTGNQFEAIATVANGIVVYVIGWLETEDAGFGSGFVDLGALVDATWTTIDCSALVPAEATAAIFRSSLLDSTETVFLRVKEGNEEISGAHTISAMDFVVPLTAEKTFDIKVNDASGFDCYLFGWCLERYVTIASIEGDGSVGETIITSLDTWENADIAPALEGIVGFPTIAAGSAGGGRIGLRALGETTDFDWDAYGFIPSFVGCDDGQFQVKTRYAGYSLRTFGVFSASQTTAVTITSVNAGDRVTHNGALVITGTGLDSVTSVNLDDGTNQEVISIQSQSPVSITCDPYDVFAGKLKFGTCTLNVFSPVNDADIAVTIVPSAGLQYVDVAGVQPYLGQGLAVQDGDQMACEKTLSGSTLVLSQNTDVLYDGAVRDGSQHTRYWWDQITQAWDSGSVTVNGNVVGAPVWRSQPQPPPCVVGVPYEYDLGALIDGNRPLTLTDAGTPLPAGLSYGPGAPPREDIEAIIGTPTESGSFAGIVTKAENSV